MRLERMSPKARVLARPDMRSSPKESVTNVAAYRRRRVPSIGELGWWSVVTGTARPVAVLQRRMRVSPTCATTRVDGEAGCQKGVGVGVEMSAIEAVEPPTNRIGPPIRCLEELRCAGSPRMSSAFRGLSLWVSGPGLRACAVTKSRSAFRKEYISTVSIETGDLAEGSSVDEK